MNIQDFTADEIHQLLYSNIHNKVHLRIRKVGFAKEIVKTLLVRGRDVISANLKRTVLYEKAPSVLYFCHNGYFDDKLINYKLIKYKDDVNEGDVQINLLNEEILLKLAFILPKFFKKKLLIEAYKGICKKLDKINIVALVCNQPELISNLVGIYLITKNKAVITVQHGVYMSNYYKPLYFERKIANGIFVWSELYRDCYIRNEISPEVIHVASPPFEIKNTTKVIERIIPIFLGQQLYKVVPNIKESYNEAISNLIKFYSKRRIELYYKPHPREDINISLTEENLKHLVIENNANVNDSFFDKFTHAYSVNSTSLIRATCNGLRCYQIILDVDMFNEDFSKYSSIVKLQPNKLSFHEIEREYCNYIDNGFLNIAKDPLKKNSLLLNKFIREKSHRL